MNGATAVTPRLAPIPNELWLIPVTAPGASLGDSSTDSPLTVVRKTP
jgi:hypothetical protein